MRSNFLCLSVTSFPRTKFQFAWVLSTNRQDSFPPLQNTKHIHVHIVTDSLHHDQTASVCGERIPRKEGERGNEKKFALKTISKFYPKIEPLYQGILHENILDTRLPIHVKSLEICIHREAKHINELKFRERVSHNTHSWFSSVFPLRMALPPFF